MNIWEAAPTPIASNISNLVKDGYRAVVNAFGRAVSMLEFIPQHFNDQPSHAMALFVTANLIFFIFFQRLAHQLNERVAFSSKHLDAKDMRFNQILIAVCVVGLPILLINITLGRVIGYPLRKTTLAAITASAIAIRFLVSCFFPTSEEKSD